MEKQTAAPTSRKFKSVILLCFALIVLAGFSMSRSCGMSFAMSRHESQGKSNIGDSVFQSRYRLLDVADIEEFASDANKPSSNEKRDDAPDGEKKTKKKKSILDQTFMRVLIGIGVFALFNVAAITIHHIAQKVGNTSNQYREIEHMESKEFAAIE